MERTIAVFEMRGFWREVEALDDFVDEETEFKMLLHGRRLLDPSGTLAGLASGALRSTSPRRSRTTLPGPPRCGRRCRNC